MRLPTSRRGEHLTDAERETLLTSFLEPDDDYAHNATPLFNAVEALLFARVQAAKAEVLRSAAWDVRHEVRNLRPDCEADAGYYDAHIEIAKHLDDEADRLAASTGGDPR